LITFSFSRCSLYLADDHVLAVDSNGFSEDYRHFYFSDIQGILTRRTRRGGTWSIILALMVACSLMGALFLEKEALRIFFWVLSGAFLVLLLVNAFRGPTCVCHILTAVQEDQLPSLNRLRVAHKVVRTLRDAIERVQGRLSPEEIRTRETETVINPVPSLQELRQPRHRKHQIRHEDGTLHLMTFALMLTDGVVTGVDLLHHTVTMAVVSSLLTAVYCICIVAALVKQHESDIPSAVRRITWGSLGYVCVSYFLSYILAVMAFPTLMTRGPDSMMTQWDMYRAMFAVSPQDSLPVMGVYAFSATCSLVLGALGLVRVKRHRDDSASASRPGQNPGGEVNG
jgi:hypothetical protein